MKTEAVVTVMLCRLGVVCFNNGKNPNKHT